MSFASSIQKLRKKHGLTQEELAHICEVSRQAISKWESGQTTPDSDKLIFISNYFNVSIDYLLKNKVEKPNNSFQNYTYSFEKICNLLLPRRTSMHTLYENAELYDLFYQSDRDEKIKKYWEWVLKDITVQTIHDCSIGTGQSTLALSLMGYQVSGSDISKDMLKQCEKNAQERNIQIQLSECDFRKLSGRFNQKYDLVMSTSNSLPHVSNEDIKLALNEMNSLVNPGGYLYIDTRNWDKIIQDHQRFYFYDPWNDGKQIIHQTQVWDYNLDGTITFNVIYTFEKDNKITQSKISSAYFYPVSRYYLEEIILDMNYKIIREESIDSSTSDLEQCDWYYILARKIS